ncbi:hypothetical protein EB796_012953 [Bugula neritina]|uniref:Uncharacterized protein n=1 Tax=Bugula neritina TaxID=10212 RepID=A0A7J7JQX7_BUGNE|nr:hypothetical protein EB796_012953 [Bugula neritina]
MASRSQHVSTNNSNPDHHNNTTSTSEIDCDTPVDGLAVTTSTNLSVSKSERTKSEYLSSTNISFRLSRSYSSTSCPIFIHYKCKPRIN